MSKARLSKYQKTQTPNPVSSHPHGGWDLTRQMSGKVRYWFLYTGSTTSGIISFGVSTFNHLAPRMFVQVTVQHTLINQPTKLPLQQSYFKVRLTANLRKIKKLAQMVMSRNDFLKSQVLSHWRKVKSDEDLTLSVNVCMWRIQE